eukprot:1813774-Rhodomonas_salina.2
MIGAFSWSHSSRSWSRKCWSRNFVPSENSLKCRVIMLWCARSLVHELYYGVQTLDVASYNLTTRGTELVPKVAASPPAKAESSSLSAAA